MKLIVWRVNYVAAVAERHYVVNNVMAAEETGKGIVENRPAYAPARREAAGKPERGGVACDRRDGRRHATIGEICGESRRS